MSKKLYCVRMGVMRVYNIIRKTNKGWYVNSAKSGDTYIARNNKEVRVAANKSDLSYFEYNHVTVNRREAKAVCEQQLKRYARYQRIDMMVKLGRPIVDMVEITKLLNTHNITFANFYFDDQYKCSVKISALYNGQKYGFEVIYLGDAVTFEYELEIRLNELIQVATNG